MYLKNNQDIINKTSLFRFLNTKNIIHTKGFFHPQIKIFGVGNLELIATLYVID